MSQFSAIDWQRAKWLLLQVSLAIGLLCLAAFVSISWPATEDGPKELSLSSSISTRSPSGAPIYFQFRTTRRGQEVCYEAWLNLTGPRQAERVSLELPGVSQRIPVGLREGARVVRVTFADGQELSEQQVRVSLWCEGSRVASGLVTAYLPAPE